MKEQLTEEQKRRILCAIQILKVDNPKITGDEIAHEINIQGFRRAKGKLWNKGTIGHLIAEGESKSDMINPQPNHIVNVNDMVNIVATPKFELSPEMEKEITPEKTLIEKDFNSDVDLCAEMARKMDIEWKKCLVWKAHISDSIKETEHDKQKFINAIANKIYWDPNCQDLDEKYLAEKILFFKSLEDMMKAIIPQKIKCLGHQDCRTPVIIKERKDIGKKRCDYHQRTDTYYKYIASDEWKEKARKIVERDGNKCICGETKNLQVHHISYERLGNEIDSDLRTLCNTCHEFVTKKNKSEKAADQESKKKVQ